MSTFNNTTGATSVDAAAVGRSSTSPFVDIFMARDPTPQDNQHSIQKKWLNTVANTFWILESYSTISGVTLANWVPITGATASITFVENFGSATPTSGIINVLGGTGVETFGVGDTITITASGLVAQEYLGNVGFAIPVDGDLNILGTGGITTTGSGNTISIANSSSVATLYTENTGTAVPSGGNLHVIGTGGITTSGSGNVITISGSGGGGSETLTGNTGGAVSPDGSNNINVQGDVTTVMIAGDPATHTLTVSAVQTTYDEDTGSATPSSGVLNIHGGTGISTSGSGNTVTINASPQTYYSLTPYIVGPDIHSQYSTISAAISAAVTAGASSTSPASIYIKPKSGGYIENPILSDGINLLGQGCTIIGKVSITSGTSSCRNCIFTTNSDYLLSITGGSAVSLLIEDCYLNISNHTGIQNSNSNGATVITISNSSGLISGSVGVFDVSGSSLTFLTTEIGNSSGSTTPNTCSAGRVGILYSLFSNPISVSGTGSIECYYSGFNTNSINQTAINTGGSGNVLAYWCNFVTGSAPSLSINGSAASGIGHLLVGSSATNAITGTGTVVAGLITFTNSSGFNTTTITKYTTYGGTII